MVHVMCHNLKLLFLISFPLLHQYPSSICISEDYLVIQLPFVTEHIQYLDSPAIASLVGMTELLLQADAEAILVVSSPLFLM